MPHVHFLHTGRCFAELQLKGIECEVAKRPYNLSVSFILSSLMLIDAIQTYGEEYELLVSSNKPSQPLGKTSLFPVSIYVKVSVKGIICNDIQSRHKTYADKAELINELF